MIDDPSLIVNAAEEETPEFITAKIGEIRSDGVTLIFPGEEDASEKVYKCNTGVRLKVGDRVKVCADSGTYLVEYAIGAPNEAVPWGLPSGGSVDQVLRRTQNGAAWSNEAQGLPSGGSAGQILKRTANGSQWADEKTELPSGGSTGQALVKTTSGVGWGAPTTGPHMQIKNGSYQMTMSNSGYLSTNCTRLGFFGVTPVSRPYIASSATLAQVIQALKNLGLFS